MIRGLGGIFIYSANSEALVAWYTRHLGIEFQYEPSEGSHYRDFVRPIDPAFGRTEREVFAIRQADPLRTDHAHRFVINLRVHDLRTLLDHLRGGGVEVERSEDYEYGRFAWIKDLDGNELELFEAT